MKLNFLNSSISSGGILVVALMATNFLNFLFNAILGRALSLEQFSVLTLINTLWFILSIFFNSLSSTATNRTAYLFAKRGNNVAFGFERFFLKKGLLIGTIIFFAWIFLIPVFLYLFHTSNYVMFLSVAPAILLGVFIAIQRGFFSGVFSFTKAAIIIIIESLSKLLLAIGFIAIGYKELTYLSIPISIVITFIVTLILIKRIPREKIEYEYAFPRKLLFATFLTVFGGAAFLSVDLLLARHFLSSTNSGAYALLSLVGKMVYFLGSLFSVFILTIASRDTGLNKNSANNFYKLLAANFGLLSIAFIGLGLLGPMLIPILFGSKSLMIVEYLRPYVLAIVLFTIAGSFSSYHLAKQQFIFAYNGIFATVLLCIGVFFFHSDIEQFINVILISSYIYLSTNVILHILYKDVSAYVDDEDKIRVRKLSKGEQKTLSASICLPAYNEEKNIGELLKKLANQKTNHINIEKIVVVSSASTDKTDEIVKSYEKKHPGKVKLIREKERNGKASAINTFLQDAKEDVVVIQSADTLPMENTIEQLCLPFLMDENIGMTGGAPIPVNNKNTFLGYVIHTWWWFHRNIPRFGEIIAFRNIIEEVSPRTAVDEAYIQAKFAQMGHKIVHVDEARVFNKGSESISDIIKQRRRIYNGHTRLQKEEHVHISHMTKSGIKLLLCNYKMYGPTQLLWLVGGMGIEITANILGRYDKYVNKVNPVAWDVAKSTKDLRNTEGGVKI